MNDIITLVGFIATDPRKVHTAEGLVLTSFRFGTPRRKYDKATQGFIDGPTSFYTVTAFRQLAVNLAETVVKGQHLVVHGKIAIREWTKDDKKGLTADVDAVAIGLDLSFGAAKYVHSETIGSADTEDDPANAGELPSDTVDAADYAGHSSLSTSTTSLADDSARRPVLEPGLANGYTDVEAVPTPF
ncbi:MAG TPA: single-stranded DNA-binding protein [Glaciihabitans sp.]|nr:single-stranded DNA-binding protein [Glaciihabitans sp.]